MAKFSVIESSWILGSVTESQYGQFSRRLNESAPHRAVRLVTATALAQNARGSYKTTRNGTEQGSVHFFFFFRTRAIKQP